jgi:hypothetical protein
MGEIRYITSQKHEKSSVQAFVGNETVPWELFFEPLKNGFVIRTPDGLLWADEQTKETMIYPTFEVAYFILFTILNRRSHES